MGKKTVNLRAPFSMRLRHDQEEAIEKYLRQVSEEGSLEIEELLEEDKSKFENPHLVGGRPANIRTVLLRKALDEFLSIRRKRKKIRSSK